jgi:hypothetical protein
VPLAMDGITYPTTPRVASTFWLSGKADSRISPAGSRSNGWRKGSYLVDPASSHMLVSKIKPCMSKYKLLIL